LVERFAAEGALVEWAPDGAHQRTACNGNERG
jgi:hypothetical protein